MDFLPEGFENLENKKSFWNTKDLKQGENRMRIVMRPIAGWIEWRTNDDGTKTPLRYRPDQKPRESLNPEQPVKRFWACYVWDYSREDLFIIEFTQAGILKPLLALAKDPEWGNFINYDIKITKTGALKNTEYAVTPVAPKPINDAITNALLIKPVKLEALFDNGDPWDYELKEMKMETAKRIPITSGNPLIQLTDRLIEDGLEPDLLQGFLEERVRNAKAPTTVEKIVDQSLKSYNIFKTAYLQHVDHHRSA